jgi:uncharacterized membrane protein
MPAVFIRQLENFSKLLRVVPSQEFRDLIEVDARRILIAADETVRDESDRADVHAAFEAMMSRVG